MNFLETKLLQNQRPYLLGINQLTAEEPGMKKRPPGRYQRLSVQRHYIINYSFVAAMGLNLQHKAFNGIACLAQKEKRNKRPPGRYQRYYEFRADITFVLLFKGYYGSEGVTRKRFIRRRFYIMESSSK